MEARAITRYMRISPRKVRLVVDTIRSKPVAHAHAILSNLNKKAARLVEKTLKSAEANAKAKKMDAARLYIREIRADGGPMLKRYLPRAMGRADVILKRTTHLNVVLAEHQRRVASLQPESEKGGSKASRLRKEKKEKHLAGTAG